MLVYRIVKSRARVNDLSGTGSFLNGGRWNYEGTYALYTSEYRSLALLETLVHTEDEELPPNLYIISIEFSEAAPLSYLAEDALPSSWRSIDNFNIRTIGNHILSMNEHLAIKVPSAVLPKEFNFILNPSFPDFEKIVNIQAVDLFEPDARLK
jgi:RES domain-containing protein